MSRNLLTYIELADILGLAPGTMRNIWRSYPYIWLTPTPGKKPNLRAVRFILEEVLAFLRSHSNAGGQYGYQESPHENGHTVRGILQVSGQADQQKVSPQVRSGRLGGRGKETPQKAGNTALAYDVFDFDE